MTLPVALINPQVLTPRVREDVRSYRLTQAALVVLV
jgi:hypothetical protein